MYTKYIKNIIYILRKILKLLREFNIYIYILRMMTTTATSIRKRESESNGKNVQLSLTHINIYTRIYLQSIKFLLNY